jgi:hypothetical protein
MAKYSKEAFSTPDIHYPDRNSILQSGQKGMTLREWYAGLALQGLFASTAGSDHPIDLKMIVVRAFQVADDMIDQSNM